MATKHQVIAAHRAAPGLTAREIADQLDCSPEYVNATARRNKLTLARAPRIDRRPERAARPMQAALLAAERFVSGFEDDELQEGIAGLLGQMREALRQSGAHLGGDPAGAAS